MADGMNKREEREKYEKIVVEKYGQAELTLDRAKVDLKKDQEELAKAREEVVQAENKVNELKAALERMCAERADCIKELKALELEMKRLEEKIADQEEKLRRLTLEKEKILGRLEGLANSVGNHSNKLALTEKLNLLEDKLKDCDSRAQDLRRAVADTRKELRLHERQLHMAGLEISRLEAEQANASRRKAVLESQVQGMETKATELAKLIQELRSEANTASNAIALGVSAVAVYNVVAGAVATLVGKMVSAALGYRVHAAEKQLERLEQEMGESRRQVQELDASMMSMSSTLSEKLALKQGLEDEVDDYKEQLDELTNQVKANDASRAECTFERYKIREQLIDEDRRIEERKERLRQSLEKVDSELNELDGVHRRDKARFSALRNDVDIKRQDDQKLAADVTTAQGAAGLARERLEKCKADVRAKERRELDSRYEVKKQQAAFDSLDQAVISQNRDFDSYLRTHTDRAEQHYANPMRAGP
ncbi:hypothetical protein FVE85_8748 [Porphyridium purpureum]|uniref:Uncharacterized protein n=1 Tax=Porphyridium purpureum TaxID=35688 RepID=A0A5J4YR84_PORPP|nr:hypothetical protein FVE85_8748 [Porphyridium purpureum]|eukprot:POR6117..scf296_7